MAMSEAIELILPPHPHSHPSFGPLPTHSTPIIQHRHLIAQSFDQSPRTQFIQGERIGFYLILPPQLRSNHNWLNFPNPKRQISHSHTNTSESRPIECVGEGECDSDRVGADSDLIPRHDLSEPVSVSVPHPIPIPIPCPRWFSVRVTIRTVTQQEAESTDNNMKENQPNAHQRGVDTQVDHIKEFENGANTVDSSDQTHSELSNDEFFPTDSLRSSSLTSISSSASSAQRSSALTSPDGENTGVYPLSSNIGASSVNVAGSGLFKSHHPSRLAPGYAPSYSNQREVVSVWSHTEIDHHSAPNGDDALLPTQTSYFYIHHNELTRGQSKVRESDALGSKDSNPLTDTPDTLVLFIQTTLTVLPTHLSTENVRQLLSLEIDFPSPPAHHHTALQASTLTLSNNRHFTIDGMFSSSTEPISQSAIGPNGYNTLRTFVLSNRALQVPHTLPPARAYITLTDPLLIRSKSVVVGSSVGGSHDEGELGTDIVIEFTLKNVSPHWSLQIHALDFMLNRSRMFVKSPPIDLSTSDSVSIQSLHSTLHYLPLGHFFTARFDSTNFPIHLHPSEQVNLLGFISPPRRSQLQSFSELIRSTLPRNETNSINEFALPSITIPFRTPFTVRYTARDGRIEDKEKICFLQPNEIRSQDKVIWRASAHRTTTMAKMTQHHPSNTDPGHAPNPPQIFLPISSSSSSSSSSVFGVLPPPLVVDSESFLPPIPIPIPLRMPLVPRFDSLSLTLDIKIGSSPVKVHETFTVFLTINNHSNQPTPILQLFVLPTNHSLIQQSDRLRREEIDPSKDDPNPNLNPSSHSRSDSVSDSHLYSCHASDSGLVLRSASLHPNSHSPCDDPTRTRSRIRIDSPSLPRFRSIPRMADLLSPTSPPVPLHFDSFNRTSKAKEELNNSSHRFGASQMPKSNPTNSPFEHDSKPNESSQHHRQLDLESNSSSSRFDRDLFVSPLRSSSNGFVVDSIYSTIEADKSNPSLCPLDSHHPNELKPVDPTNEQERKGQPSMAHE